MNKDAIISLSSKYAKHLIKGRNKDMTNFIRNYAEYLNYYNLDKVKQLVNNHSFKIMKTEYEYESWKMLYEISEKVIKEDNLSNKELVYFIGYLAREVKYLYKISKVHNLNYSSSNRDNHSKGKFNKKNTHDNNKNYKSQNNSTFKNDSWKEKLKQLDFEQ